MCYRRKQEEKRRLKLLFEKTKHNVGGGAYFDEGKQRIVKYSLSNRGHGKSLTKFLKNESNRKIRRLHERLDRGSYKKIFDYWYELI